MGAKLYIVRHCEASGNKERFFQGQHDSGISELGRVQLSYLAERFRGIHIDAIYTSPLGRARMTAEAVNRYHGLPIITDDRLMEIDGGEWEGKRWSDLPALYPREAGDWIKSPHLFRAPGGESMAGVQARMIAAVTDIARACEGKAAAVCSHGCAIRCLDCWAGGMPIERLRETEWCDNTGITLIEMDGGRPRVVWRNDISHVPEEYSTFAKQLWWKNKDEMNFDQ